MSGRFATRRTLNQSVSPGGFLFPSGERCNSALTEWRTSMTMTTKTSEFRLPAFHEEDAILALIEDELRGGMLEDYYELQKDIYDGLFDDDELVLLEAFQNARAGEIGPLAALLRPEHPLNELRERPIRAALSDEMWEFLADVLEGIRDLSEERKRCTYRRAEGDFHAIRYFLEEFYSEQTEGNIRDLALKFAAARHKVDQEDLWKYLNRTRE
jgi:hypothetical protein